jgi:hypothetical protein
MSSNPTGNMMVVRSSDLELMKKLGAQVLDVLPGTMGIADMSKFSPTVRYMACVVSPPGAVPSMDNSTVLLWPLALGEIAPRNPHEPHERGS